MSIADDLLDTLEAHQWRAVTVERDNHRLELHPLHGKLGAGFTLLGRNDDGAWTVVATGHTEHGALTTPHGGPQTLPDEIADTIAKMVNDADE